VSFSGHMVPLDTASQYATDRKLGDLQSHCAYFKLV